jgi:hypothetical protein
MIKLIVFLYLLHPTPERVYYECINQGLLHSDIVTSQAIVETGHFKSYNCTKRNNLFGLLHKSNITESNPNGYYKFDSWRESVTAYRDKVQYRLRDNEDYYLFLKRIGYAEAEGYIKLLKQIRWEKKR